MKTLLIAENNSDFAYVVEWHFQQKGMRVFTAASGKKALELYHTHSPNIVLLDISLDDDIDGKEVARRIRAKDKYTPILFMSGESKSPADVVEGFDIGCNFFLKKPVTIEEIEAHINTLQNTKSSQLVYKISGVIFNTENRTLSFDGKTEYLTEKETKVLQILADYLNNVVELQTILDNVWNGELSEESLRNNISSLRKKLASANLNIKTIKNKGYMLNDAG
ncbi:response regulator transcription factor [Williamwhitmania taraxaci]|uniref:DNA-binding response regulator, OmpR family, contains REC and winged-helix (WHTH) domain n=1 Tax=Williamwhitmania taraxaci TaxID=1640674 RepID=A0A1G6TVA4_9BACT|nr:response regulator transcription factor [Williamwhitmania taraxaci]SDD33102.1 DNA-binding response regulator, OmpR family, contains REC and winged-helix (wHTH) domain [Williamwhitmania taraxaci]